MIEVDIDAAREGVNLNTGLGLGQHDQGVRRLIEGLEVEGEVRGADGIHSKNRSLRIEQVVNDRSSSDDPITSVDTVFQVEDYHVGHRRGLGESIGTVCGTEEQRRTERCPAHSGLVKTMVARFATATTSPC